MQEIRPSASEIPIQERNPEGLATWICARVWAETATDKLLGPGPGPRPIWGALAIGTMDEATNYFVHWMWSLFSRIVFNGV